MEPYDKEPTQDYPHHTEQTSNPPVSVTKVEDDDNIDEKDLKRSYLFGDSNDKDPDNKGYESHGMGGQSFGEQNVTRSGDDEANPSQNAGYDNDYFKRTEPLEEHPENNNFTPNSQQGAANTNMGQGDNTNDTGYREDPEQEKVGGGEPQVEGNINANGGTDQQYQTGTADNDGTSNQHQDGELQTKGSGSITEDDQNDGKADFKPEDNDKGPDYGSNSPEKEGSEVTGG